MPLLCVQAKFLIDKDGNVVERNGDNPLASEAKIQKLLAA
jgi:glutathione peroxidase-family protein